MERKEKIRILLLAFVFGVLGGVIVLLLGLDSSDREINIVESKEISPNVSMVSHKSVMKLPDFTEPAEKALQSVVFVKTEYYSDDYVTNFFYGSSQVPIQGHGSGVIISPDGYIVTNNHVIDKASNIIVTLNDKREFEASVIGKDPTTDLALLKIEADSLDILHFGNSDDLQIGEWVLAIGNPFNLASTVTAGIVSAKARDISIMKKQYAIESFIQTDAAVNPGNSGGALINVSGDLVGINSAIASPTGSYAGYSFAIPASIVQKVVADFIEYGNVQRAFMGVKIADIDKKIAKRFNLLNLKGVFVSSVIDGGAAFEAGIEAGDVILQVNKLDVEEVAQLLEIISRFRPGDKVILTVRRNKNIKKYDLILKNEQGGTNKINNNEAGILGATFEDLSDFEKSNYGIKSGVLVSDVMPGKFLSVGMKPGMIITKINNIKISSVKELEQIMNSVKGGVYIEGYDPHINANIYFAFGIDE